jgi:hypothetical protein
VVVIQRLKWEVVGMRGDARGGVDGCTGVYSGGGGGDTREAEWESLNGSSRVVRDDVGTAGEVGGSAEGRPAWRDWMGRVSDPLRSGCFKNRSFTGAGAPVPVWLGPALLDPKLDWLTPLG